MKQPFTQTNGRAFNCFSCLVRLVWPLFFFCLVHACDACCVSWQSRVFVCASVTMSSDDEPGSLVRLPLIVERDQDFIRCSYESVPTRELSPLSSTYSIPNLTARTYILRIMLGSAGRVMHGFSSVCGEALENNAATTMIRPQTATERITRTPGHEPGTQK